jgi:hypothetical protein
MTISIFFPITRPTLALRFGFLAAAWQPGRLKSESRSDVLGPSFTAPARSPWPSPAVGAAHSEAVLAWAPSARIWWWSWPPELADQRLEAGQEFPGLILDPTEIWRF